MTVSVYPDTSTAIVEGSKDDANSTTAPLGSGATFTGDWVVNNDAQLAVNCLADQDGSLYVEFSIDGTTALQTLSKFYQVFANQGQFDALVKMPGRYHRVRFVNGGTAQTSFGLLTATAPDGLFPFSIGGRDAPAFAALSGSAIGATEYQILVDLSDRVNYPHHFTGRADIHAAFLFVDRATTSKGDIRIGIIVRVDGTDADVVYLQGVSFEKGSETVITRDRIFNTPLLGGQSGGLLTKNASGFKATGVTAINTGLTLPTFRGTATPAVGDIVVQFAYASGAVYDAAVSIQYTTASSTT